MVRTCPLRCIRSALHTRMPNGKNTAEVHPLCTAHTHSKWQEHPLRCIRSALHTRMPNGKNTRWGASAQHCTHACQIVRTPAEVHPLKRNNKQPSPRRRRISISTGIGQVSSRCPDLCSLDIVALPCVLTRTKDARLYSEMS